MDDQDRCQSNFGNFRPQTNCGGCVGRFSAHAMGGVVVLALLSSSGGAAYAAPAWQYTASANAAATLTDNVLLVAEDEETDFMTSLSASFQALSETRAGSIDFSYQLSYDYYLDTDELNGLRHNLMTHNTFVVADDMLFLDVSASLSERSQSRNLRTPGTARTINGDQSLVFVGSIGPRLETTISDRVGVNGHLDYSIVDYSKSDVSDGSGQRDGTTSWSSGLGLHSLGQDQRLGWEVFAESSSNDNDLDQQSAGGLLRLRMKQNFRLLARGGYDSTSGRRNGVDIDDAYWRVGFEAEPIRDSSIRLEVGERYNEPSYDAMVDYAFSRALKISASYVQSLQTNDNRFATLLSAWEPPTLDPSFRGIVVEDPYAHYGGTALEGDIVDHLTLNDTARVTLSGGLGHIVWSIDGAYRTREFAELDGIAGPYEEEMTSASIRVSRNFGRRIQASISGRFEDEESDIPMSGVGLEATRFGREIDVTSGQIFVSYSFSPTAQATLNLSTSKRESEAGLSVEENVIMLTVAKSW